jgi:hypothetical protein
VTHESGYPTRGFALIGLLPFGIGFATLRRRWEQLRLSDSYGAIVQIGAAVMLLAMLITAFVGPAVSQKRLRRAEREGQIAREQTRGQVMGGEVPPLEPNHRMEERLVRQV